MWTLLQPQHLILLLIIRLINIKKNILIETAKKSIRSEFEDVEIVQPDFEKYPDLKKNLGAFVTLKIYDVLGREVTTLVNEELTAGTHETVFDASGISSGVYFYQIKAEGFIETKKMILLR